MYLCIAMQHNRQHCDNFFHDIGVVPTYVPPVLKQSLNVDKLINEGLVAHSSAWSRRTPLPPAPKTFEIACSLSHLRACYWIVQSKANWAFVFEDDNVMSKTCAERFKQVEQWAKSNFEHFNVVNLSPCNSTHMQNGLLSKTQGCTNALLYSRKGAMFVIKHMLPIRSPIDDWLHMNAPNSYCIHSRIFCQKDAVQHPTIGFINPVYCKYERLINTHSVTALLAITSFVSLTLYTIYNTLCTSLFSGAL